MANWIRAHGGEYVREVTAETTHLICTIEDFKKRTAQGLFSSLPLHPLFSYDDMMEGGWYMDVDMDEWVYLERDDADGMNSKESLATRPQMPHRRLRLA